MDFWTVVLAVVAVAVVFVVLPVAAAAWSHWRRPMRLTCPRVGAEAQIQVAATRSAVAAVLGHGPLGVEKCSLWPVRGCRDACLALPAQKLTPVRRGSPRPSSVSVPGLHTIVVPLDGSAGSEAVLDIVPALARSQHATLHLVHVRAPLETLRADDDDSRVVVFVDQESERLERESRAYFGEIAARLGDVRVEGTVRFGDPLTEIVDVAESTRAELIAMATHHRGFVGRLTRRSLARRLARATTIPLLLVPYDDQAGSPTAGERIQQPSTVAPLTSRSHHVAEAVYTGRCRY